MKFCGKNFLSHSSCPLARSPRPATCPRTRIERIAAETTGVTADTALRLGTSAQLWMNLQNRYDVEIAKREIGKKLDKIEPIIAHAAA